MTVAVMPLEPTPTPSATAPLEFLYGWAAICKRAGMSEKTAREMARFGREGRLPVYVDHRGRHVASAVEIDTWKRDRIRAFGAQPYGVPGQSEKKPRKHTRSRPLPSAPARRKR